MAVKMALLSQLHTKTETSRGLVCNSITFYSSVLNCYFHILMVFSLI